LKLIEIEFSRHENYRRRYEEAKKFLHQQYGGYVKTNLIITPSGKDIKGLIQKFTAQQQIYVQQYVTF